MNPFVQNILCTTGLVPALAAMLLAPSIGLRKYLACRALQGPSVVCYDPPTPPAKFRSVLTVLAIVVGVESLWLWALNSAPEGWLSWPVGVVCGLVYFDSVYTVVYEVVGGTRKVVFRDEEGRNVWRRQVVDKNKARRGRLVAAVAAIAISIAFFLEPSMILLYSISFSMIYRNAAGAVNFRLVPRWFILATAGYITVIAVGSAIAIPVVEYSIKRWGQTDDDDKGEVKPKKGEAIGPEVIKFLGALNTVVFVVVPTILASIMYRFDHNLHSTRSSIELHTTTTPFETVNQDPSELASPSSLLRVEIVSGRMQPKGVQLTHSPGVVVPHRNDGSWKKAYYWTVVLSWLATNIALLSLPVLTPSGYTRFFTGPASNISSLGFMMMLSFPLSIVTTSVSVLGVAALRGEGKELWSHVEEWTPVLKERESGGEKDVEILVDGDAGDPDDDGDEAAEVQKLLLPQNEIGEKEIA